MPLPSTDLGGGVMGIEVGGLDGLITGFQIEGTFAASAEPKVPALGPAAVGLLAVAIVASASVSIRRRRVTSH